MALCRCELSPKGLKRRIRAEAAIVWASPLPGFLAYLAPVLDHYGYLAVGGFVPLEDFGVPVPGETILIAAAVYAGAGRLSVTGVGLIAFLAAVTGGNLGYAIGRFGMRALVLRYDHRDDALHNERHVPPVRRRDFVTRLSQEAS